MAASENCLRGLNAQGCRALKRECIGCAWDREEDARRRALPLRRDKKTGLLRKNVVACAKVERNETVP